MLGFGNPATYRIVVQGKLPENYSDRLAGMKVSVAIDGTQDSNRTILQGRILDQAQLNGVLDTLHQLHLSLLSVERT